MKDPYLVLGVSKTATQDEIKKAYRSLAKKYHPDLNPGNKAAEAKFKELSHAHDQIGSVDERAKFDKGEAAENLYQQQSQSRERPSYYDSQQNGGRYSQSFNGAGFGESDFFENLFRSAQSRTGGPKSSPEDYPGEDQLYQMEVEFKDAALGAEREITLPGGKKLLVKIPAGIHSGAKLRFKGQGNPGQGKGPAGDALVEISIKPLKGFNRVQNNIETELPISFQEGILGAEIKVATLSGSVMLKVPAGTSTGARLRIRGKGAGTDASRGDQIAIVKIVLPKVVDPKLQEAVRALAPQFNYDPRSPGVES